MNDIARRDKHDHDYLPTYPGFIAGRSFTLTASSNMANTAAIGRLSTFTMAITAAVQTLPAAPHRVSSPLFLSFPAVSVASICCCRCCRSGCCQTVLLVLLRGLFG